MTYVIQFYNLNNGRACQIKDVADHAVDGNGIKCNLVDGSSLYFRRVVPADGHPAHIHSFNVAGSFYDRFRILV